MGNQEVEMANQLPYDPMLGAYSIAQRMLDDSREGRADPLTSQRAMDVLSRVYPETPKEVLGRYCCDIEATQM